MLVFFASGNAKVISFALADAKVPNARYFAFWWNIGLRQKSETCFSKGEYEAYMLKTSFYMLYGYRNILVKKKNSTLDIVYLIFSEVKHVDRGKIAFKWCILQYHAIGTFVPLLEEGGFMTHSWK